MFGPASFDANESSNTFNFWPMRSFKKALCFALGKASDVAMAWVGEALRILDSTTCREISDSPQIEGYRRGTFN